MPIRTNRGRAAVYRRLWGWPLRSPKHLVAVGLFVLAIVLFLGYILPRLTGGSQASPPAATTSTSARATSTTPSQGATGSVPPLNKPGSPSQSPSLTETRQSPSENKTPAKADPQALDTALKWADKFVNHPDGTKTEDWLNGLRPYTMDEYLGAELTRIDPRNIQATKVRGGPVATGDSYTTSVTVEIPTDAKKLSISLIKTNDGWRVNDHSEVD